MNYQQHLANSAAIRAEIQRFESVHPNIYSIYELLERVEEPLLQNQIREHVIAIEACLENQDSMKCPDCTWELCRTCGTCNGQGKCAGDAVTMELGTALSTVDPLLSLRV
ncbi:arf-GAP with GTPase, ANK repeat and PH domain-containing protein 1 [Arapaima gigas]